MTRQEQFRRLDAWLNKLHREDSILFNALCFVIATALTAGILTLACFLGQRGGQ